MGLGDVKLAALIGAALGLQASYQALFLGIMGGGLILLVLSISNLIFGDYRRRDPTGRENGEGEDLASVGIVPIGIPLIVGPAAITSILVSREAYGYLPTLSSLVINMVLVFLTLAAAPYIGRFTGAAGSRAIAKVASLFLAAISVAMIRAGVLGMIKGG